MKAQTIRSEQPEQATPFAAFLEKFGAVVKQLGSASALRVLADEAALPSNGAAYVH